MTTLEPVDPSNVPSEFNDYLNYNDDPYSDDHDSDNDDDDSDLLDFIDGW